MLLLINMDISELVPLTYSMLINNIDSDKQKKVKSEYTFLNLETLVEEFPLDDSFVSKSYYQSKPEYSYCSPPKGPIDQYFDCIYCRQSGPDYHTERCPKPLNSSLYLNEEGARKYTNYEEGTSYSLVVVKRGQKKVVSASKKSDIYYDSVQIKYKDVNDRETIIRISKNGTINIISAGFGNNKLAKEVVSKINQTSSLIKSNYNKVYPSASKLMIIPELTYTYLIFAQFNLYPKELQDQFYVNLSILNTSLMKYKKKTGGETILALPDRDLFYYLSNYRVNLGDKPSKSNKMTNPTIIFTLIPSDQTEFKISVSIYKRGSVQLRASYVDSHENDLNIELLETCHSFLEEMILGIKTNFLVSEIKTIGKESFNTYDGKKPQACADRYGLRPVPYGWFGTCPDKDMYVRPEGKKRGDGRFEPCCYKIKGKGTQDSEERIMDIIKNGYPDKLAKTFGEFIPDPDVKSAMLIPGTKEIASRRRPGLMDMDPESLINCISDAGYIPRKDLFDQNSSNSDYVSFKKSILAEYQALSGSRSIIVQNPETLTPTTAVLFTKNLYIITPINDEALNVLMYFNESGNSYFINANNDISETSLPPIVDLVNTIIEGYLYPYEEEFIFYPIDILFIRGQNIMDNPFINQSDQNKSRYAALRYSIDRIQSFQSQLDIQIENRFDLNIVKGSSNFLTNVEMFGEISSLLFIPYTLGYIPKKVNKNLILWNNSQSKGNKFIALNVERVNNNKWKVSIDSRGISNDLLPQEAGVIEIPVIFATKKALRDGDLVLFEINLFVNGKINTKKPLVAIDKLDEKINDYNDVKNILQSIQTPISKNVFININKIDPPGFTIGDRHYYLESFAEPMKMMVV